MSSPSALLKVNYLVLRCLHFESLRGELQEGHFYASRCQFPVCSSTKMAILCSGSPKMGGSEGKSAQKPRFCARNARKWGFRRQKAHKNLDFVLGKTENLTSGLVLVLLLMLIIDNLDVAIFCIDWIYNNYYFILHCQR